MRARELDITIGDLQPGARNAISDVEGVLVGHSTLIEGDDVRTGVTVIVPPATPLFAGCHRLNGNGELTGLEWVRESGTLTTPVAITNTHSVGVVRDALVFVRTVPLVTTTPPEQPTLQDGWATFQVVPTASFPLKNGFHVQFFVRVRKPGDTVLVGVGSRRLVQVRTATSSG